MGSTVGAVLLARLGTWRASLRLAGGYYIALALICQLYLDPSQGYGQPSSPSAPPSPRKRDGGDTQEPRKVR